MRKYFTVMFVVIFGLFLVSCDETTETKTVFNIKYIVENEEVDLNPNTYEFIDETLLPTYQIDDHIFGGWYTNTNFDGEAITTINRGSTGDKTFYGKLFKAHKLTLEFNGAEEVEYTKHFHEEQEVILPTNINKNGYTFKGWYSNADFTGNPVEKVSIGTKTDLTLYANFLKLHKLTLNFNGGEVVNYQNTFTIEEEVLLPKNIIKNNYTFDGWYLNPDFTGTAISKVALNTNVDLTLYAKFVADVNTLTLVFNGGTEIPYNNIIKYDEVLELPTNIEKEHYEFSGWYLNEFFTGDRVYFIEKHTNSDITLYANFDISDSVFSYVNLPDEGSVITNNINLNNYILDEKFYVVFDNINTDIIDNEGILKRPYVEKEITITIKATDYINQLVKDFTYTVAGYKSLNAPIRSGYIFRDYFTVNDYYFENQEIIYTAFVLADALGNFTHSGNTAYFGRTTSYIMPKAKELGVRVIMSVGPSSEWRSFSKTAETRENFADNVVELINQYGFDGVDLDWETPRAGYGEDKYFTSLVKIVNEKVKANNPNHLVTTAITGGSSQPSQYDLRNSGQYLDYINLMTYGMSSNSGLYQNALHPRTSWHNPAFLAGRSPGVATISNTISIFNNSYNIPSSKLIVGVAFYGIKQTRRFDESTNSYTNWINGGSLKYEDILFELERADQTRVFDEVSKVPYIINDSGTVFISYDDPESIKLKAEYVMANNIAGMMYWEYYQEYENILLTAMVENLPKS